MQANDDLEGVEWLAALLCQQLNCLPSSKYRRPILVGLVALNWQFLRRESGVSESSGSNPAIPRSRLNIDLAGVSDIIYFCSAWRRGRGSTGRPGGGGSVGGFSQKGGRQGAGRVSAGDLVVGGG